MRARGGLWSCEWCLLIQRLQFHDRCTVVVTDPETHGRRRVIHKHAADVCKSWKQILDDLSRFRIQPQYAIAEFASRPCLALLVCRHVVGPRFGSRGHPLLEMFGFRIEHSDPVRTVLTEP